MKLPQLTCVFVCVSVFASVAFLHAADKPSIQDILATKITFEHDNNSFESGLLALEAKIKANHPGFQIQIIADDLKFEGITKNQRINGLKLNDTTLADVLTAIVIKANSNPQVKDPSDPRLNLVWVVAVNPNKPEGQTVLITTRSGAKKRGEKLPAIFEKK